jgi:hypothetical protein
MNGGQDVSADDLAMIFGTQDNFDMIKNLLQTQQRNFAESMQQLTLSKSGDNFFNDSKQTPSRHRTKDILAQHNSQERVESTQTQADLATKEP